MSQQLLTIALPSSGSGNGVGRFGRAPRRGPIGELFRRVLARTYRAVARLDFEGVQNIPRSGPCVLVFNHLSNFDAHLLFTLIPRRDAVGLVAAEYRKRWWSRWLIEAGGVIWLRRGRADRRALKSALGVLEGGGMVGIAPEGMRTPTGGLIAGKKGAAFLAVRGHALVVPIGIDGTERLAAGLLRLRRFTIRVRIGEPFRLPALPPCRRKQHLQACTDRMMAAIAGLLPPARRGIYGGEPVLPPDPPLGLRIGMVPRNRLDLEWSDLLAGLAHCFRPANREAARRRVEEIWRDGTSEAVACLSVRSGFDLLLQALALPRGSEVAMSAVTIQDMARIVRAHGLVPVPVDLDMDRLAISAADLERAITPRTRLIVVAHLFGSRMPLAPLVEVARRHDLPLIEDCAQAYVGSGYLGEAGAHVSMFSFGPIKTNTALGGALLRFRDAGLAARVREIEATRPVQPRREYVSRVLRSAVIQLVLSPPLLGLLARACHVAGTTHDSLLGKAVRGFPGADFFARIRRQPSYPLLALLERRLSGFDPDRVRARVASARSVMAALPGAARLGSHARFASHWVSPFGSRCRMRWPRGCGERAWMRRVAPPVCT